ncbi:ABC transporter substrate-binding protein [Bowmanella sp. JS7-9]|uniref:ABC transporter substrate-binding protein n=1 Tax=Pseudobowmanella zhangzhouensis TaxID=1537679 RepID=A0ABW1XM76_9ALTE|nr:ABC transporter substrate-binding protein [Bowmanella sp. JS7-9]TBX21844.1 toluene tolerance protein [Bowmanella sp. JS7-9]
MFKKVIGVVLLVGSALSFNAAAVDRSNPYDMVKEAGERTFARLHDEQALIQKDPNHLRVIMNEELLPYIDYKYAALKVLGRYFGQTPREKIPEYMQEFRDYLINTYATVLAQYDNQKVVFQPAQDVEDDSNVTVRALIQEPGRPDIKIAFKVRKNDKTEEWAAYDMVAEGTSLLSAKRSELEGILGKDGIDAVIKMLKEKNAESITLPEKKL